MIAQYISVIAVAGVLAIATASDTHSQPPDRDLKIRAERSVYASIPPYSEQANRTYEQYEPSERTDGELVFLRLINQRSDLPKYSNRVDSWITIYSSESDARAGYAHYLAGNSGIIPVLNSPDGAIGDAFARGNDCAVIAFRYRDAVCKVFVDPYPGSEPVAENLARGMMANLLRMELRDRIAAEKDPEGKRKLEAKLHEPVRVGNTRWAALEDLKPFHIEGKRRTGSGALALTSRSRTLTVSAFSHKAKMNGLPVSLRFTPVEIGGDTLVPLEAMAETLRVPPEWWKETATPSK